MSSYSGKMNLLKFRNACIVSEGAYIDFTAWENQQPGKYGDTHSIRQSLAKEVRERMTDDELKAVPYFGNMKPYTLENAAKTVEAPSAQVDEGLEDLPF